MSSIQSVIPYGVRKVNIDTDGRIAVTAAIRKVFAEEPEKFDPREYLGPARITLGELVASKMKDLGTAGHAGDIKQKSLEDMKEFYKEKGLL